jgi:hypothetical protein
LLVAKYQLGQLLAASVGELPDQPPPRASAPNITPASLPATAQLSGIPASAVVTGTQAPATTRSFHLDNRNIDRRNDANTAECT